MVAGLEHNRLRPADGIFSDRKRHAWLKLSGNVEAPDAQTRQDVHGGIPTDQDETIRPSTMSGL